MTQNTIKTFRNKIRSEPPKKNYVTNKTDFYHPDYIWSLDFLDVKYYCPENNRRYRHVLVVIDISSKFGFKNLLKKYKCSNNKRLFRK